MTTKTAITEILKSIQGVDNRTLGGKKFISRKGQPVLQRQEQCWRLCRGNLKSSCNLEEALPFESWDKAISCLAKATLGPGGQVPRTHFKRAYSVMLFHQGYYVCKRCSLIVLLNFKAAQRREVLSWERTEGKGMERTSKSNSENETAQAYCTNLSELRF